VAVTEIDLKTLPVRLLVASSAASAVIFD
jgi:hypothetical protein